MINVMSTSKYPDHLKNLTGGQTILVVGLGESIKIMLITNLTTGRQVPVHFNWEKLFGQSLFNLGALSRGCVKVLGRLFEEDLASSCITTW